ncbi:MAG: hypothetical protein V3W31_08830 [Thermodesulfobacteriota bacterium]
MTHKVVESIEEANAMIDAFTGNANDFKLRVSDKLQDPTGISMTIITDTVLSKGWEPDGFVQKEGFRTYSYKELE